MLSTYSESCLLEVAVIVGIGSGEKAQMLLKRKGWGSPLGKQAFSHFFYGSHEQKEWKDTTVDVNETSTRVFLPFPAPAEKVGGRQPRWPQRLTAIQVDFHT